MVYRIVLAGCMMLLEIDIINPRDVSAPQPLSMWSSWRKKKRSTNLSQFNYPVFLSSLFSDFPPPFLISIKDSRHELYEHRLARCNILYVKKLY